MQLDTVWWWNTAYPDLECTHCWKYVRYPQPVSFLVITCVDLECHWVPLWGASAAPRELCGQSVQESTMIFNEGSVDVCAYAA